MKAPTVPRAVTGAPAVRVLPAELSSPELAKLLAVLRSGSAPGQVRQVTERFGAARGDVTGFVER